MEIVSSAILALAFAIGSVAAYVVIVELAEAAVDDKFNRLGCLVALSILLISI